MKPSTVTDGNKVKWYGNSDHKTSDRTYYYNPRNDQNGDAAKKFEAVVDELARLSMIRDPNCYRVVELIALRRSDKICFVAFRWTSDWAYDTYDCVVLQEHGYDLGRGGFKPFTVDQRDYKFYLE